MCVFVPGLYAYVCLQYTMYVLCVLYFVSILFSCSKLVAFWLKVFHYKFRNRIESSIFQDLYAFCRDREEHMSI